jgi:hypothetical protein
MTIFLASGGAMCAIAGHSRTQVIGGRGGGLVGLVGGVFPGAIAGAPGLRVGLVCVGVCSGQFLQSVIPFPYRRSGE